MCSKMPPKSAKSWHNSPLRQNSVRFGTNITRARKKFTPALLARWNIFPFRMLGSVNRVACYCPHISRDLVSPVYSILLSLLKLFRKENYSPVPPAAIFYTRYQTVLTRWNILVKQHLNFGSENLKYFSFFLHSKDNFESFRS